MADYLKSLFGNPKPAPESDDDFADYAGAPEPEPASILPFKPDAASVQGSSPTLGAAQPQRVYTKWYRVWERTSRNDFLPELVILPFMILIIALHLWGRRGNKTKAKAWVTAHAPVLQREYAQVGFGSKTPDVDSVEAEGLAKATEPDEAEKSQEILKEKSAQEFITYGSGRQNVAFTDIRLTMYKRYNPATLIVETILSFLFESIPAPTEKVEVTTYAFDGREKDVVPAKSDEQKELIETQAKSKSSVYDQFVWAVVHKDNMKRLRDERYDISLTTTRDHDKLPVWCSVMSENSEITEKLLTDELVKALHSAGEDFQHLIVTDQPIDKPQKLDEAKMRKRMSLSCNLPSGSSPSSYDSTLPLFSYFLRLPDQLASQAHFRPEVRKKILAVREEEQKKISKAGEEEKAEERRLESEKKKKEMRDQRMRGMSAEEQRKFLEKEREKSNRKQEKRKKVQG